jgi:hypothetical protein
MENEERNRKEVKKREIEDEGGGRIEKQRRK